MIVIGIRLDNQLNHTKKLKLLLLMFTRTQHHLILKVKLIQQLDLIDKY